MFILYTKSTCHYCHKVLRYAKAQGISLETKDTYADPTTMMELIQRGGKRQVPYLVDEMEQVEMYESEDIISYLEEKYACKSASLSQ